MHPSDLQPLLQCAGTPGASSEKSEGKVPESPEMPEVSQDFFHSEGVMVVNLLTLENAMSGETNVQIHLPPVKDAAEETIPVQSLIQNQDEGSQPSPLLLNGQADEMYQQSTTVPETQVTMVPETQMTDNPWEGENNEKMMEDYPWNCLPSGLLNCQMCNRVVSHTTG